MATVTFKWSGNPPCGAASPPYPGEKYTLFFDKTQFTGSVPTSIVGTFISEGAGGSGYDRTYTFEIDDDDVPEEVTELCAKHFKDIGCMDGCCEDLTPRVIALEELSAEVFRSVVTDNEDGTYTHDDGSGTETVIDVTPSTDADNAISLGSDNRLFVDASEIEVAPSADECNSITLGSDGRLYSEDAGYRLAKSWQEVIDLVASGKDVLICKPLSLNQNTVLNTDRRIKFVHDGAIDLNGFSLQANVRFLNPNDRWVFKGVIIDETYPARWNGSGSNLIGHFGRSSIRYPDWFGAIASDTAFDASLVEREQNNHAIAAAALSVADNFTNAVDPVVIQLAQGGYAVHRPVRLDGRKASLRGHGAAGAQQVGTSIVAHSNGNVVPFDTSHFIETFKYPGGTTPVVELGFEFQVSTPNPDVGMQCGVQNIAIRCPQIAQSRPISGIMWEYGLQENAKFSQFAVDSYSGYGVGCPEEQHLGHNQSAGDFVFPQTNSVIFEEFTIASPAPFAIDCIGMGIHGLAFTIRNGTVRHHNSSILPVERTAPPIYVGSRTAAVLDGLHIEHFPSAVADYNGAMIVIEDLAPGNVNVGAIDLRGIMGFVSQAPNTTPTRTIWTNANNVAFHMSGVRSNRIPDVNHAVIEDAARGVLATGNVQAGLTSGYVSLYARQFNQDEAAYRVLTTDFGLR